MNDVLITRFDDKSLAHYGRKGMKWHKHIFEEADKLNRKYNPFEIRRQKRLHQEEVNRKGRLNSETAHRAYRADRLYALGKTARHNQGYLQVLGQSVKNKQIYNTILKAPKSKPSIVKQYEQQRLISIWNIRSPRGRAEHDAAVKRQEDLQRAARARAKLNSIKNRYGG